MHVTLGCGPDILIFSVCLPSFYGSVALPVKKEWRDLFPLKRERARNYENVDMLPLDSEHHLPQNEDALERPPTALLA